MNNDDYYNQELKEINALIKTGSKKKLKELYIRLTSYINTCDDQTFKMYGFFTKIRMMIKQQKYHSAEKLLNKLTDTNLPNYMQEEVNNLFGELYEESYQIEKAKKFYEKAFHYQNKTESSKGIINLMRLQLQDKEYDAVLESANKLFKKYKEEELQDFQRILINSQIAEAFIGRNNLVNADIFLENARIVVEKTNLNVSDYYLTRGKLLHLQGKDDEAKEVYEQFINSPFAVRQCDGYFSMAELEKEKGNKEESFKLYAKIPKIRRSYQNNHFTNIDSFRK